MAQEKPVKFPIGSLVAYSGTDSCAINGRVVGVEYRDDLLGQPDTVYTVEQHLGHCPRGTVMLSDATPYGGEIILRFCVYESYLRAR